MKYSEQDELHGYLQVVLYIYFDLYIVSRGSVVCQSQWINQFYDSRVNILVYSQSKFYESSRSNKSKDFFVHNREIFRYALHVW